MGATSFIKEKFNVIDIHYLPPNQPYTYPINQEFLWSVHLVQHLMSPSSVSRKKITFQK